MTHYVGAIAKVLSDSVLFIFQLSKLGKNINNVIRAFYRLSNHEITASIICG